MTLKVLRALCAAMSVVPLALMAQTPQPPQSSGTSAPITLQQAVDRARTGNPSLLAAHQHVSATQATKITAGLRQNPTLTLLGQGINLPEINKDRKSTRLNSSH